MIPPGVPAQHRDAELARRAPGPRPCRRTASSTSGDGPDERDALLGAAPGERRRSRRGTRSRGGRVAAGLRAPRRGRARCRGTPAAPIRPARTSLVGACACAATRRRRRSGRRRSAMPSSAAARTIRMAISPRLATNTVCNATCTSSLMPRRTGADDTSGWPDGAESGPSRELRGFVPSRIGKPDVTDDDESPARPSLRPVHIRGRCGPAAPSTLLAAGRGLAGDGGRRASSMGTSPWMRAPSRYPLVIVAKYSSSSNGYPST